MIAKYRRNGDEGRRKNRKRAAIRKKSVIFTPVNFIKTTMRNLFFLLLFCPAWVWAQPWRAADTASGSVRLCFIGDVMQHEPQIIGA